MSTLYSHQHVRMCSILRRERKLAGLSQAELAKKLEKSQSYVAKFENGQQRLDVIEFLNVCAALNYPAANVVAELEAWGIKSGN